MKPGSLYALLAGLAVASSSSTLQGQATGPCRPPDASTVRMARWLTHVATRSDPGSSTQRRQMGLPTMTAVQVTQVTDTTIRRNLLDVYQANVQNRDAATGVPIRSSGRLYVFKVGTVYVATDPAQDVGEFSIWVTTDSAYTLLGSSLG